MKEVFFPKRMWSRRQELKRHYDVVIVGGGSHGLATAYYLAKKHGIRDICILEKSYIGAGAAGRNTTIIRSNYRTPEGAAFYSASVRLYEKLSQDLDFNMMFSQHGHLTLAHSDRAMNTMRERAEVNKLLGINSSVIYPDQIRELCPELDLSSHPPYPIIGALYHPPGGIIRHDAVVWGYARQASKRGVEIHQGTEVTGFQREGDRITGVETSRGTVHCGQVVSAVAGWSSIVGKLVEMRLPITTHILQAFVTEPMKPFLDVILVSSQLHVYVSQTDRGEFLIGSEIEPYTTYRTTGTLSFLESCAGHAMELLPQLERTKLMRTWSGLCDLSPDYSPILGKTEIENFHVSAGWGTYGFKAAPIVGVTMAELVASGKTPDLIAPFALERFHTDTLVSELAAAAVSH
jgi:sarcosine oxidase subunit beta